jgi:recombination protein U
MHKNNVSYANRGMTLEEDINITNKYYLDNNIGVIHKKPTPITINKVDYPSRLEAVIKEAHFNTPSTTDYNGVYKGKYIDFDAKETLNKTAFPLSNIHEHQTEHIRRIIKHGGIAFLIIRMNNLTYLLTGEDYLHYIDTETRKSISYKYIQEKAHIIKEAYQPSLDYIKVVEEIYFKGV